MWYLIFLVECLGNFKLAISGGYFKNGWIDKGEMSSASKCACACDEKIVCVAFGFRDDNQKCYFYIDVSDLKEQVVDVAANNYIKNIPGNNSLLTYTLLKINSIKNIILSYAAYALTPFIILMW